MRRFIISFISVMALYSIAITQESATSGIIFADEILIVRAILDSNGLQNLATTDICTQENNRLVAINLTNKTPGSTGISKIPAEIGKLTALRELHLANNSLKTLPDELANCTSLKFLDIGSNQMNSLPPVIGKIASLEKLDIRYNGLTEFPEIVLGLNNLTYLHMWGNYVTSLPESLNRLTKLKELYLRDNRLTMLPHSIAKMKTLIYIDYDYNKICKPYADVAAWLKLKDKKFAESQKCW
jgi:Leucine-rich repeat (LRR) protein